MEIQRKLKQRNASSINFTDLPTVYQYPKKFVQKTILPKMLTDSIQHFQKTETKIYSNKVNQIQKQFTVPRIQQQSNNNTYFKQYLEQNKKFVKPYSQCTRYADNLSQHKKLIRRGLFNAPSQIDFLKTQTNQKNNNKVKSISHSISSNKESSLWKQSFLKLSSKIDFGYEQRKKMTEIKTKSFDKSLKHHKSEYQILMKKQRNQKQDYIKLQNAMNKMLSSQLINHKIHSKTLFKPKFQDQKKSNSKNQFQL